LFLKNWSRSGKIKEKAARFRRVNVDKPHAHHDALEFPNGDVVLLTRLTVGQTATVLQLPVSPYDNERGTIRASSSPERQTVDDGARR
jgi:hypothetical protein